MWCLTWKTIPSPWQITSTTRLAHDTTIKHQKRNTCKMPCVSTSPQTSAYSLITESWMNSRVIMHEYVWHHQHEKWLSEFNKEQMQMQSDVNTHHHSPSAESHSWSISHEIQCSQLIEQPAGFKAIPEWLWMFYSNITSVQALKSDSSVSQWVIWADSVNQLNWIYESSGQSNSQQITARHFSDILILIQHVQAQTDGNTPTGITHWSDKTSRVCLLPSLAVYQFSVNWPQNDSMIHVIWFSESPKMI